MFFFFIICQRFFMLINLKTKKKPDRSSVARINNTNKLIDKKEAIKCEILQVKWNKSKQK